MFLGISATTLATMAVGSFAVALGYAAQRRDPLWVLALGIPLLLCADRAALPPTLVAWGCALYAAFALLCVIGLLIRRLGGTLTISLIAALAGLAMNNAPAAASARDLTTASLHRPPAIGLRLQGYLDMIVAHEDAEQD